jgi:hypothetical protein
VNGFALSVNAKALLCQFSIIEVDISYGCSLKRLCMFMNLSSNLALTLGLGEAGRLVDIGTPAVNGGTKVSISGSVIVAVVVGAVVGAITPIFVETGMAMVAPTDVDTLAPTVGADITP